MRKIRITKIILGNLVCIGAITPLLTSCDTQEDVTTYTLYFYADITHGHLEGDEQITVDEGTKWQDVTNKPTPKVDTDGFIFDDWYYKGKALQPEDVISSDMEIQARFKKAFTPDTDFEWSTDGNEATIVEFNGTETDVLIPKIHTEGGKDYRVTSIGDEAFKDNVTLSSVVIPELSFKTIGNSAFEGCTNLTSINFPKSLKTIGNSAFEATKLSSVVIPEGVEAIAVGTFQECANLSSVTFSNTVTSIGNSAFEGCINLSLSKLPDSVENIGNSTFKGCLDIESLIIPSTVTSIGENAFDGCTNLNEVKYNDTYDNWKLITFGENWHLGCPVIWVNCDDGNYHLDPQDYTLRYFAGSHGSLIGELSTTVKEGTKWKNVSYKSSPAADAGYSFDEWYFNGEPLNDDDIITSSMDIEARFEVTPTPDTSFEWKTDDETGEATIVKYNGHESNVVVPWKYKKDGKRYVVTTIGDNAFNGCQGFSSLILPHTLKTIGDHSFCDCTSLLSIDIPYGVTTIAESAFRNCSSVTSIHIPNSVTAVGKSAFAYCRALTSIVLPDSITKTSDYMFDNCGLTSITFSSNFDTIGYRSFESNKFTSFVVPRSVKLIQSLAFYGCKQLSSLSYDGTMAQWKKDVSVPVKDWYQWTLITKVHCTDGDIQLDPWPPPDMSTNGNIPSH